MVMNIRVLTPDRVICSTTADEVVLPGLTGQVGVLDGHAALITALDTGLLRIKLNKKQTPIILCGGLAEIDRNRVTVLVNDVEELSNIELREATKDVEKATLAVENAETSKARLDAAMELKKATARLEAINYLSQLLLIFFKSVKFLNLHRNYQIFQQNFNLQELKEKKFERNNQDIKSRVFNFINILKKFTLLI